MRERGFNDMKPNCDDQRQEQNREYHRKWRAANPDKVKAAQMRYWEKMIRQLQAGEAETRQKPEVIQQDMGVKKDGRC